MSDAIKWTLAIGAFLFVGMVLADNRKLNAEAEYGACVELPRMTDHECAMLRDRGYDVGGMGQ